MDPYQILDIPKTTTQDEIKKAFKKLALRWHPDKNLDNTEEAEEKFKEISNAYEKINTREKKKKYDNPYTPGNFVIVNFQHNNLISDLMNQVRNVHMQSNIYRRRRIIKTVRIVNGVMTMETIVMN